MSAISKEDIEAFAYQFDGGTTSYPSFIVRIFRQLKAERDEAVVIVKEAMPPVEHWYDQCEYNGDKVGVKNWGNLLERMKAVK